jgi:aromatic-L-amino-acid decarboxylase
LPESAVAELIAALTNRFVTVWRTAPGLAQIETTVIRWFCDLVGYPAESGGFLASGGSTATLTAVITARVNRLGHDLTRATAYTSAQAHHAVEKSAFLAGIPRANVRKISVNELWQVDVEHLRRQLAADVAEGFQPFLIVGNAGTTNTGAIDDLRALADLAAAHRAWFHVDGAYGGFFLLTERGRQRMPGINRADSIVLDPHKALFLPYGTGCLLVRRQADLRAAHQFTSDYMPDMSGQDECVDLCALSPELSRSGRGLRVWLPLVLHGAGEFRRLLNEKLDLAEWATTELESLSAEWGGRLEIVARPQLSILAFRLTDPRWSPEEQDQRNERWLETINRDGRIMITGTYLGGRYALRIAVVSFRTHYEQVAAAIEIIRATGPRVLDE